MSELVNQPIPHHVGGMAGGTVLLEPQLLIDDMSPNPGPHHSFQEVQIHMLVELSSLLKPEALFIVVAVVSYVGF